jgi:siroheme synthase
MPGRDLNLLVAEWLAEGLPADLPCAVVSRAAQPDQQVAHTTLGELASIAPAAAPSILIAGWALRELDETSRTENLQASQDACRVTPY